MNRIVLTLLEAEITLYPANADGSPQLDQPLWTGACLENLSVADRWIKLETRPTGARYPRRHPLVPQYEISIGRVWALPLEQLNGFIAERNKYVMDILWVEEETRDWHRELYYGVTIAERSRENRDARDGEFVDRQQFDAEYFIPTSGTGTPPAVSHGLARTVRYLGPAEDRLIYVLNPATDNFTEAVAGVSAGRAVLAYEPDHSGKFEITFAGEPVPALRVTAGGVTEVFSVEQTVPDPAVLPRLEFYHGSRRVASLSRKGELYAPAFRELQTLAPGDKFKLFGGSAVAATLDASAVTASVQVFTPTQVSGLKGWYEVEAFVVGQASSLSDAPIASWADASGNGNTLLQAVEANQPDFRPTATEDEWTHHKIGRQPAAYFQPTRFVKTSGNVFNPDRHWIVAVVLPFGPGPGTWSGHRLVNSGSFGASRNDYSLLFNASDFRAEANFWPDFIGSAQLNFARSAALWDLSNVIGWKLFEQEASSRTLTANPSLDLQTGTLPAAFYRYSVVQVTAAGERSPSEIISLDLSGGGGLFLIRVTLPAADGPVTSVKIYRNQVSGDATQFLLATVAPATLTYDDNQSHATFLATNPAAMTAPARAGNLTLRMNGTQLATVADLVGLASGISRPIQIGAASGGLWGYVKAVLVFEGVPSTEDQARVRQYLNNKYGIY